MKFIKLIILLLFCLIMGCELPPSAYDGQVKLQLKIMIDIDGDRILNPLPNNKITLISSAYGNKELFTDSLGNVNIENLPYSNYSISAVKTHPVYNRIKYVATKNLIINSQDIIQDTITLIEQLPKTIIFNEIYFAGPDNNIFYFYDQFIEIFNASDKVEYLDGISIARVTGNSIANGGTGTGSDYGNDGDIDSTVIIFKFPGRHGEKNYPINPGDIKVLAVDAVNHKNTISNSIDLSNADWEFFNQYSFGDGDNKSVPNILNLNPQKSSDFIFSLTQDILIMFTCEDSIWEDGIDIKSILDGIQYQPSSTKKTLDARVDKSSIISPPRYSGKSIQRINSQDTDNGAVDWIILDKPTPGVK